MKMRMIIAAAALIAVIAVAAMADLAVGTKAPDFTLQTLDCKTVKLSDNFRAPGKVVVLDLWATWCPPCQAVTPNLIKINKKYAGKPVKVIGVALDEDPAKVSDYVKRNKINYTVLTDPQGATVGDLYKLTGGIPALYIIDKTGVIKMVEVGFPYDKQMQAKKVKQITDLIDKLLMKK